MPFTFSHPIYVLPLKRISPKYISITGLVLGSMAPDFEYFIMLEPFRSIGHSLIGLLIQAIPISVLLAVIFHNLVKESVALHLPLAFNLDHRAYSILGKWRLKNLIDSIVFLLSVVIGFISHVFIDSFTHSYGYFVNRYSILSDIIIFNYPLFKILQYSLSVLGLFSIVVVIINRLYKSNPISRDMLNVTKNQKIKYWLIVIAVAIATTSLKLAITTSVNVIGILVVSPISGVCLGLILASLITRKVRPKLTYTEQAPRGNIRNN